MLKLRDDEYIDAMGNIRRIPKGKKVFKIDVEEMPEFIEARNLKEAVKMAEMNISVREFNKNEDYSDDGEGED